MPESIASQSPSAVIATAVSLVALASAATAEQGAACQAAFNRLTEHLPEVAASGTGYQWRGLPTHFKCDADGNLTSVTVRWQEGRGLLIDARSAIAALGARMTGDTATAVRSAFDRCMASASRSIGETAEANTGRALVSCTVGGSETEIAVAPRSNR